MIKIKEYSKDICYGSFFDEKFKFNNIIINFIVNLKEVSATENAIVAFLLRSRCKKYNNSLKLGKKLRSLYGADLFCDVEKKGDKQIISFGIYILDDIFAILKEPLINEAFNLLKEFIFCPMLDENGFFFEKDVNIEKQNIKDIIKSLYSDKRKLALYRAKKVLFEGTNFAINQYGDFDYIKNVTEEDLKKAYINLIKNSKVFVFYGGHQNHEKEIINFLYSFSKRINLEINLKQNLYFFENFKQKEEVEDIAQAKIVLGFAIKNKNEKVEFINHINNFVMSALFGGVATSLLFTNVRERLSLCYYCRSFYDRFTGVLWVESGVESENIKKAVEAVLEQFNLLKIGDFKKDQLQKALSMIEAAYSVVGDSSAKMANYFLNSFLKQETISYEETIDIIKKVEKKDIIEAANRFSLAVKYILKPKNF